MARADPAPRRTEKPGRIPSELILSRYLYKNPQRPAAGDRRSATEAFSQGVEAQEQRRFADAVAAFKKAAELDPGYYEAYYNWGWAAYQVGDLKEALYAFEYALAVVPDSGSARHNFSLALKRANYPQDAAIQLHKILAGNPADTRALLALGNLYASELALPALAREQYLKLLELDPKHPRAAELRSWIASHP
jgi:tetratricopeptide (TPR) repeat protein